MYNYLCTLELEFICFDKVLMELFLHICMGYSWVILQRRKFDVYCSKQSNPIYKLCNIYSGTFFQNLINLLVCIYLFYEEECWLTLSKQTNPTVQNLYQFDFLRLDHSFLVLQILRRRKLDGLFFNRNGPSFYDTLIIHSQT